VTHIRVREWIFGFGSGFSFRRTDMAGLGVGSGRGGEVLSFLPLRPIEFEVLLSLQAGERHGYGIVQDAASRSAVDITLGLGTLYRALRRLVESGLIEAVERREAADAEDERRNYYAITDLGRAVAVAEARRMEALVGAARSGGLLDPERA
jgi:DNA-binding PadR family transcriptional regulator